MLSSLAEVVGASEAALRLLISVLVAYPIVIFYRLFLHKNSNITRNETNLIFTVCGILICIFNYGYEVYHSLLSVTFTYIIINLLYKSKYLVPISFVFHMSYLLMGYYKTSTENYDICWTMCHCVMVLHLIGLTYDVADSIKKPEVLGISDSRPYKIPSLLEVFGFAYFPPTVIIGPQFSFKRYYEFVDHKYDVGQQNFSFGLTRFLTGVLYLSIYQLLFMFVVPDKFFMSNDFDEKNIIYKILLVGIWGRASLYKYISCWILSEGAAICAGLAFVSKNEKTGEEDWSGCSNIKLSIFENTYNFGDYVNSFNKQTNLWVLNYVYKRLKFLNNKSISHISALLFLAVWHGYHDGYYITFFLEFIIVHFEKESLLVSTTKSGAKSILKTVDLKGYDAIDSQQSMNPRASSSKIWAFSGSFEYYVEPMFKKNPKFQEFKKQTYVQVIIWIILKTYTFVIAGYCLIPFVFLSFYKWWAIYKKLYFFGFIVILPMPLWSLLIKNGLKIFFPYEKTAEKSADGIAASKSDRNNVKHDKVN